MNKTSKHKIITTYFDKVTDEVDEVVKGLLSQAHRATILDSVKDLVEMTEEDESIDIVVELRAILTAVEVKIKDQVTEITDEIEQLLSEAVEPYKLK